MANKVVLTNDYIEIKCDRMDPETLALAATFPIMHSNRVKNSFKTSLRNAPEVLKTFRNIDENNISKAPEAFQSVFFNEMNIRTQTQDLFENGPRNSCYVTPTLTLMQHQQLARELAMYHNKYAFFYDTRTGKTPISLSIIFDDIKANPTHKWLVICPLILIENAWIEDIVKFMPDITYVSCHANTPEKRLKLIKSEASIYIINTEAFVRYSEAFKCIDFAGCILDESSSLKSNSSKISKEIVDISQSFKRLYLLSGTPASNGEFEYYMQMKALDKYMVQEYYKGFKEYYFFNTSYNPQFEKLLLRPDRYDELFQVIKKYAIYVDKEDVLTTPGRTFIEHELTLPPDLKKQYTKLKNEMYMQLKDEPESVIKAVHAGAKVNKLNQITSGFIIDTENKTTHILDMYRFEELYRLLETFGDDQVIIWCNYHKEFELIKEQLGNRCVQIYGEVTLEEKNLAVKRFKAGEVQYLVANPASADKGLTLTNAHIAVYFSLNWSYELFKQSCDRIYADISKQPLHCLYYVMIAKGTIDRVLYSDVLLGKGTVSMAILNHLKAGALNDS